MPRKKIPIGPYSAYAIAVKYGYDGTEEQWINAVETARKSAESSASTAKEQADKATDEANTATEQATTATTKAGEAATSATQAETSQKKAAENQQAAEDAAGNAANAAADAVKQAKEAGTFDGQSAYALAVQLGYNGSESDWIASLKGDKGDKGDTGPQGPKGDPGGSGQWELLEKITLRAATASVERTFSVELSALKVLFQAGTSQAQGTLHWVCSTSDGTQILSGTASCTASSAMTSPITRTYACFQALPCFGQYLCLSASGSTGTPLAAVLPADNASKTVDCSQKIGQFALTIDTDVRIASGAAIELWGVKA